MLRKLSKTQIWQILLTSRACVWFWPRRSSNSSFNSLHIRIYSVSKHHGRKKVELYLATNYCPFSCKFQKKLILSIWKKISGVSENEKTGPKENGQRTTWLKICVKGFGAILSAFLNHTAHLAFFPNSILITCSQIVVFQTACSFITMELAVSDSVIESYIVYRNWYSE